MKVLVVVSLVPGVEPLLVDQITGNVFTELDGATQRHLLPLSVAVPLY